MTKNVTLDALDAIAIAEWLESAQCGLMGDERVQRAAKLLLSLAYENANLRRQLARTLRQGDRPSWTTFGRFTC